MSRGFVYHVCRILITYYTYKVWLYNGGNHGVMLCTQLHAECKQFEFGIDQQTKYDEEPESNDITAVAQEQLHGWLPTV